jgi:hypothetical protein
MTKVKGSNNANAMEVEMPGISPIRIPTKVPRKRTKSGIKSVIMAKPAPNLTKKSIISLFHLLPN